MYNNKYCPPGYMQCSECIEAIKIDLLVDHCYENHGAISFKDYSEETKRKVLLDQFQNYHSLKSRDYILKNPLALCNQQCGKYQITTEQERDEFFIHQYSEHRPCYKCERCGVILTKDTMQFHKQYNCDDIKAGLEYRTHYEILDDDEVLGIEQMLVEAQKYPIMEVQLN